MYLGSVYGLLLFIFTSRPAVTGTSYPCRPNPCENGGICSSADGNYTCHCNPGYAGKNCDSDAQDTTAESSTPPRSTEEDAATANDIISSTSSSSLAASVTYTQILSSQSSSYVIASATNNQTTLSPTSVLSNAVTSHLTVSRSSNFFDEVINIAIVASLGAILTVTSSSVACYYLVTSKFKKSSLR